MPQLVNGNSSTKALGPGALSGRRYIESLRDGRGPFAPARQRGDLGARVFRNDGQVSGFLRRNCSRFQERW
jgi:hypothetical protein